jgi:hypothetical protein
VKEAAPLLAALGGSKHHADLSQFGNALLHATVDRSVLTVSGFVALR